MQIDPRVLQIGAHGFGAVVAGVVAEHGDPVIGDPNGPASPGRPEVRGYRADRGRSTLKRGRARPFRNLRERASAGRGRGLGRQLQTRDKGAAARSIAEDTRLPGVALVKKLKPGSGWATRSQFGIGSGLIIPGGWSAGRSGRGRAGGLAQIWARISCTGAASVIGDP